MNRRSILSAAPLALPWSLGLKFGLGGALALQAANAFAEPGSGKPVQVGAKAPVLMGNTMDNMKFDLKQEMTGKTVLVSFWATWCPVCRTEMPDFRRVYEKLRPNQFDLVTVAMDKKVEDVLKYDAIVERTVPVGQRFPRLWRGDASLRDEFGPITSTPTTVLVNRKGMVTGVFKGRMTEQNWAQVEKEALAKA